MTGPVKEWLRVLHKRDRIDTDGERRNNNSDTTERMRGFETGKTARGASGQGFLTTRTLADDAGVGEVRFRDEGEAADWANGSRLRAVASDNLECSACKAGFRVDGEAEEDDDDLFASAEEDRDLGSAATSLRVDAESPPFGVTVGSEYLRLLRPRDVIVVVLAW